MIYLILKKVVLAINNDLLYYLIFFISKCALSPAKCLSSNIESNEFYKVFLTQ